MGGAAAATDVAEDVAWLGRSVSSNEDLWRMWRLGFVASSSVAPHPEAASDEAEAAVAREPAR